jgi:hypothetical protein
VALIALPPAKEFIKTHRNIGPNNFKSQILNFKMRTAKDYTQL